MLVAVLLDCLLNHLGRGTEADEDRIPTGMEPTDGPPPLPRERSGQQSTAWSAFTPRNASGPQATPYAGQRVEPYATPHADPYSAPHAGPSPEVTLGAPPAPRGYLAVNPNAVRATLDPRQDETPPSSRAW
ncbi:hypothetical protein [Streptomyces gardneri]|uniref:hypothetical protein n=1 Tax=Streptomyces gardneri TaxID=66892 RepID=UPI0033C79806